MHVAFDTLSENPLAPSSAINFFISFAETLPRVRQPEDRWSILVSPANRHLFEPAAAEGVDLVECPVSNEHIVRRIVVQQTWLPRRLRRLGADVILGYNVVPLAGVCARAVKISTLHHYETPDQVSGGALRVYYRTLMFRAACARAEAVIANSTHTRDAIVRYMALPQNKISIVHEAVSDSFVPARDFAALAAQLHAAHGLTPGYVLFASTIWRYKNLDTLIKAMTHLPPSLRLVVAGKNGDTPYYDEIQRLIADRALQDRVRLLGEVPNEQLVPLFQGSSVFVNPSRSETYGKPVVEAMRCGVPVVAARAGSLPEISGGAAELVDPNDDAGMADAIARLLYDDALRAQSIAKGLTRGQEFSWEATVRNSRAVCVLALDRFRAAHG